MRYIKALAAAFILALFLSGCSAGKMISDMSVVQGIALDREGGEIILTVQYLDLNKGSGKNEGLNSSLTANAQGRGKTLAEATQSLIKTMPDSLFAGQAKLLVIGSGFNNENDIKALENELLSNKNIRCDMLLAKSEKAYKVLECGFRNERVPIDGICKELKAEKRLVTVNDYLINKSASLPEIKVDENSGYVDMP